MNTRILITSVIAFVSFAGTASAAQSDTDPTNQQLYCHWVAEAERSTAIDQGQDDLAVQLAYEDASDYCNTMSPSDFAAATGTTELGQFQVAIREVYAAR